MPIWLEEARNSASVTLISWLLVRCICNALIKVHRSTRSSSKNRPTPGRARERIETYKFSGESGLISETAGMWIQVSRSSPIF